MADTNYLSKEALDRVENRFDKEIKDLSKQIRDNTESIIELRALYTSLVKLPETISSLEKTVIGINNSLERMNERMDLINSNLSEQKESIKELRNENNEQNRNIEEIDNKSKIDWATAITGNFWKLFSIGIIIVYIVHNFILK